MEIELRGGEAVEKEIQGDYWGHLFGVLMTSQTRGHYSFTNERIVFKGGFATEVEIPYNEIESITKCNVGGLIRLIPTGIKVQMKNGKKHFLSVLKRKDIMDMIQQKIA